MAFASGTPKKAGQPDHVGLRTWGSSPEVREAGHSGCLAVTWDERFGSQCGVETQGPGEAQDSLSPWPHEPLGWGRENVEHGEGDLVGGGCSVHRGHLGRFVTTVTPSPRAWRWAQDLHQRACAGW